MTQYGIELWTPGLLADALLIRPMNKTFSKSYIIPPLELILDYIVLNYCVLAFNCFTTAENHFIRVISLRDRKQTAPNIKTEPIS